MARNSQNLLERLRAAARAFVLGSAVVEPFDMGWGHDTAEFSPPEYGSYIATSSLVYSTVSLRADLFADLPLKIYTDDKAHKEIESGPVNDILSKVNPFWTWRRLQKMSAYSLDLWGQNFWFVERGNSGRLPPREIWWGRPDHVRVVPDPDNYISEFLYFPDGNMGGTPLRFMPSEVVWFRNVNPMDEFAPLSPLAAARMGADLHNSAMQSNHNLFKQGMQIGGIVMPPKENDVWTTEQVKQAEELVSGKLKGVENSHKWLFFRQQYKLEDRSSTSPKDAEFVETLNLTLEEVARAYRIPLDILGGQRTYANVEASERGIYQRSILPLAGDIASEINEQFIPMFQEKVVVEFDDSDISALHENETDKWTREGGKIEQGAITINEWRKDQGLKPVEWGDTPRWVSDNSTKQLTAQAQMEALKSQSKDEKPAVEKAPAEKTPPEKAPEEQPRAMIRETRTAYGSAEHMRIWTRFDDRSKQSEKLIAEATAELFRRQKDSIVSGLKRSARSADEPFNKAEWIRKFREGIRPVFRKVVEEAGTEALKDLGLSIMFKLVNPSVRRFIERRAQRFAEEVNETTWNMLKEGFTSALEEGKGLIEQMKLVEDIMGDRIRSSSETIARTESIGALNGGQYEAWKQSDVVSGKEWIATLDGRVRDAHQEAHGQVVGLEDDFTVDGESLAYPGADGGSAGNVINCRCTIGAVVKE